MMDDWLRFDYSGTSGERGDAAVTMRLRQLDEFVDVSRSKVQALIEAGGVVYDGKLLPRPQKNLRPGMLVEVNLCLLRKIINPPAPEDIEPLDMPLEFHHIDDHLAVIEKPPGISVHPSPTEEGPTLVSALLFHLERLSDEGGADRPGIVHRLDKETSGLLVVARDNSAHTALSRQFADRLVEKEYAALTIDPPEEKAGRIDLPVERHPADRRRMHTGGFGKPALTEYRLREMWGPLSLIDVAIFTGRTHQIRVHLQTLGCAILNDDKYGAGRNGSFRKFLADGGDRSARRHWKAAWPDEEQRNGLRSLLENYPGIFLHSQRLAFTHPVTGKKKEFSSELPEVWRELKGGIGAG